MSQNVSGFHIQDCKYCQEPTPYGLIRVIKSRQLFVVQFKNVEHDDKTVVTLQMTLFAFCAKKRGLIKKKANDFCTIFFSE